MEGRSGPMLTGKLSFMGWQLPGESFQPRVLRASRLAEGWEGFGKNTDSVVITFVLFGL